MILYSLMTLLFISLAIIAALDSSLTSFTLLPWFNGLRWLRVHLVTLGAVTESIFGFLPLIVALRAGLPRPKLRWDIWLSLNIGLIILLIGIPIINQAFIFTGGTLIFVATLLLIMQLRGLRQTEKSPANAHQEAGLVNPHHGRKFYIAGLSYFLLGILIGTGLWLGLNSVLQIKTPVEVHIHANNWGFLSLVFAGLLIDLYPRFAQRPLAWPRSITPIFWLMTIGALGLVIGPWIKSNTFSVPGLVMHLTATIWLLLNVIRPLRGARPIWSKPGIWHLVTSYAWILAPVLIAPLIILKVPGFPGAGIEANAPQALVYGWVLQFGYAVLPYFFRQIFQPAKEPTLGGNWFSLIAVHLGGIFLWASIFIVPFHSQLHGLAYALWFISLLPIVWQLWQITRDGLARFEELEDPSTMIGAVE